MLLEAQRKFKIAQYCYLRYLNWLNYCISDSDNSYLNHCMRA